MVSFFSEDEDLECFPRELLLAFPDAEDLEVRAGMDFTFRRPFESLLELSLEFPNR